MMMFVMYSIVEYDECEYIDDFWRVNLLESIVDYLMPSVVDASLPRIKEKSMGPTMLVQRQHRQLLPEHAVIMYPAYRSRTAP